MQPHELEIFYDSQISEHLEEVRRLREQRNADCSKTRNLPAEILTKIIGILEHSDRDRWEWGWNKLSAWVQVTHVCRAWRAFALNEPRLWTNLVAVSPDWLTDVLSRSKSAPLRLRFSDGTRYSSKYIELLNTAVTSPERIEHLEIRSDSDLLSSFTKPAPMLESLEIRSNAEFPPDFLGGSAPRLRYIKSTRALPLEASWLANVVRLECQKVHFEAAWLSQLTTLALTEGWDAIDATSGAVRRVNVDTLLSALENMPSLQRLSFAPPKSFDAAPSSRSAPVHLHHLHDITVELGDKCEAMALIFDSLMVDSIHTLETIWPRRWVEIGTLRPVCHFFATYYEGPDLHVLRCTDRDTQFSISLDQYTVPALSFKEHHPRPLSDFMRLLPCCTPRILDTNITATNVDSSCLRLVKALHRAPVEELHVVSSSSVLHTLFKLSNRPNPSYPFLRRLHIKGLDDYDLVPRLKRWIAARRSVARLEHLVIKGCDFFEEEIDSLQKIPSPTVVTILP
ncbi:hypothetical protein BDN71DRAFT_516438 [Pleurotus eryngii]|uniref:F-box domain-containing protein n=1 Tax=Pleurotus eryngii TaxID=5323 RepID=A0A9P6A0M1_PLEER|nr:hypothetical protein BDN71DRAFT_516438 [Pleurotus eryngii]